MKNLYINQKIWCVKPNQIEIREGAIISLTQELISAYVGSTISIYYAKPSELRHLYSYKTDFGIIDKIYFYVFYNEVNAIRYAKSQMIHRLQKLEKDAKAAVEELVKYRNENFELLNCKWLEDSLRKMEQVQFK